ncbi:MAG: hypothetical protein A2Z81_05035 [Omnitrophica WOR_2 bacterium GWA2_45_18]|nr:MAG: hypothetical protein A2Z81_05035 [Omnitrophica WOR_2 bacterium GWA2_45_18]
MKTIIYIIILVILLLIYVYHLENKTVFAPARDIASTPAALGFPFEDLYLTTEDGVKLNAWFIQSSPQDGTLIFLHGNAGNIGDRLGKIDFFHKMGLNILIFDYRGYGKSGGYPSEKGIYSDARAAYDYLLTRQDVDPSRLGAYGGSLGGVVAVNLATQRRLACLIIDSSFSSGQDMAKHIFPVIPGFLVRKKLDAIGKIKQVGIPKLFIHSIEDEIVPLALGKKLYAAAIEPKRFLEIVGDHNDGYLRDGERIRDGISQFLKELKLIN